MTITTNQPDPQAALAAGELGRLWLERWIDRARRVFGSRRGSSLVIVISATRTS